MKIIGQKKKNPNIQISFLLAAIAFALIFQHTQTAFADPLVLKSSTSEISENKNQDAGRRHIIRKLEPVPVTGGACVTWIGDSYTVMAESLIEQALPGADIYAAYGKHTQMDAPDGYGGLSGISILSSLAAEGKLRNTIVFALGTNDPIQGVTTYASYLQAVMEIAGEDRSVVFVTPFTMEAANGNVSYQSEIDAVRQTAADYPNAAAADWAAFCQPYLGQFYSFDNIHPVGYDGIESWTALILQQLEIIWAE